MLGLGDLGISLDKRERGATIDFISHAHSDHISAARSSRAVLASTQTVRLINESQAYSIRGTYDDVRIRLLEAGHMLGSRQLCIDDERLGKRIVYSGDFQMERSLASKPIEIVDTDVLILDSTYSNPSIRFDRKSDVVSSVQEWTSRKLNDGIVLFKAYAMGKAQELIAMLNEAGMVPVVSRKISGISKIYRENGFPLNYVSMYDDEAAHTEKVSGNFVGISESRGIRELALDLSMIYDKRVYTAVATGWAKAFGFGTDAQFPLSDHADFYQSISYIERSNAKEIYTYGHSSYEFAANLRRHGYDARPFAESKFATMAIKA